MDCLLVSKQEIARRQSGPANSPVTPHCSAITSRSFWFHRGVTQQNGLLHERPSQERICKMFVFISLLSRFATEPAYIDAKPGVSACGARKVPAFFEGAGVAAGGGIPMKSLAAKPAEGIQFNKLTAFEARGNPWCGAPWPRPVPSGVAQWPNQWRGCGSCENVIDDRSVDVALPAAFVCCSPPKRIPVTARHYASAPRDCCGGFHFDVSRPSLHVHKLRHVASIAHWRAIRCGIARGSAVLPPRLGVSGSRSARGPRQPQ